MKILVRTQPRPVVCKPYRGQHFTTEWNHHTHTLRNSPPLLPLLLPPPPLPPPLEPAARRRAILAAARDRRAALETPLAHRSLRSASRSAGS